MCGRVALQLCRDDELQMAPLANELPKLISLLPPLQSMFGDARGLVLHGQRVVGSAQPRNRQGQAIEHGRDVIVELSAGE